MTDFKRLFDFKLHKQESAFVFGARKTGKSTLLAKLYAKSKIFDLLDTDLMMAWAKRPKLMREEVLALESSYLKQPIIIDEIQKIPSLLDEVHWLIENKKLSFILCGSSARKLRQAGTNLLGGRAFMWNLFPLVSREVPNFNLHRALLFGLIPQHYNSSNPKRLLNSYVKMYLQEEIRAEALTRNLPAFARFLEAAALSTGNLLNYTNIAQEAGVSSKSVKEYFQILEDTLIGYQIYPLNKSRSREIIFATPKFYFFDTGLLNTLKKITFDTISGFDAGQAFEHWVQMELRAYLSYREKEKTIYFWKTKTGQEIDFIVEDIAIDVTIAEALSRDDLKGLLLSATELDLKRRIVVCQERRKRIIEIEGSTEKIEIYPWQNFISELWEDKIL